MALPKGFTLIELLIVIVIVGILSTAAILTFGSMRENARIASVKEDLTAIRTAIQLLAVYTSEWPNHQVPDVVCTDLPGGCPAGNEMADLSVASAGLVASDGLFSNWDGPYIDQIPLDPWGNNYFLDTDYDIVPGAGTDWKAVIGSFGPNGVGLNLYDSDDIVMHIAG